MPLYSLPTDNVIMTCFASSAGGRLFMGGADGNLCEIQYEATDRWLKRRCTKVRVGGGLQSPDESTDASAVTFSAASRCEQSHMSN